MLEAMTGQIFLATLVAKLVASFRPGGNQADVYRCPLGVGCAGVVTGGVGCEVWFALAELELPPAFPLLATFDTQSPMPRLPGLGFGLVCGLGRAALQEATALVTTLP